MEVKGKKGRANGVRLGVTLGLTLVSGLVATQAMAQVVGPCANCHTMHNSQNGSTQARVGNATTPAYAAWDGTGKISGGADFTSQKELLKSDCVGCHSNSGTETILTVGAMRIPIVFNTSGYPAGANGASNHALAGGNFYNVATQDTYGHNVRGISKADATLTWAPGDTLGCGGCHQTLTVTDAQVTATGIGTQFYGGCRGCHTQVGHHNSGDLSYRYLGGHGGASMGVLDGGGTAPSPTQPNPYEDKDWEQTYSATKHNFYKRQDASTNGFPNDSVGAFCAGCHSSFHSMGIGVSPVTGVDNGGDPNTDNKIVANSTPGNPWLRHPTSVNIPNDGEYAPMFASGGIAYNPDIPVAQDPADTNKNAITAGDQVFCLSCHRAHGSDQPDALRFPYSSMLAHNGTGAGTGCFYCHTTKDNP